MLAYQDPESHLRSSSSSWLHRRFKFKKGFDYTKPSFTHAFLRKKGVDHTKPVVYTCVSKMRCEGRVGGELPHMQTVEQDVIKEKGQI